MARYRILLLASALAALIAATSSAIEESAAPASAPHHFELTLLHTNDWHGYALPERPRRSRSPSDQAPLRGGIAGMRAAFDDVRAKVGADKVLAFDTGDLLSGHPAA